VASDFPYCAQGPCLSPGSEMASRRPDRGRIMIFAKIAPVLLAGGMPFPPDSSSIEPPAEPGQCESRFHSDTKPTTASSIATVILKGHCVRTTASLRRSLRNVSQ